MADNEKAKVSIKSFAKQRREMEARFKRSNEQLAQQSLNLTKDQMNLATRIDRVNKNIDKNSEDVLAAFISNSFDQRQGSQIDTLIQLSRQDAESKDFNKRNTKKTNKNVEAAKKDILKANQAEAQKLVMDNRKKVQESLATYNLIMRIVPKMRLAIGTYADSIISPDDFTRTSLSLAIDETFVPNKNDLKELRFRCEDLIERYNINKNLKRDILSYIRDGRMYYIISSMNKQLEAFLTENLYESYTGFLQEGDEESALQLVESFISENYENAPNSGYQVLRNKTLNENTISYDREGKPVLSKREQELVANFNEAFMVEDSDKDSLYRSGMSKVDEFIEDNFYIGTSKNLVCENYTDIIYSNMDYRNAFMNAGKPEGTQLRRKYTNIGGRERALLKYVSAANIVKLEHNDVVYGYLYLDIVESGDDNQIIPTDIANGNDKDISFAAGAGQALAMGNFVQMAVAKDVPMTGKAGQTNVDSVLSGGTKDPRVSFVADIFANKLADQTNLKLLRKDETLKNAIYNGLALRDYKNKKEKVRVIFLEPEEVVEIDRGQSIFDNILFFAKIYISSLLSALMHNVINGAPKRAVFVEVGLDNDPSGTVQEVIRDLKSKDLVSVHKMDLQSILNVVGDSNAYYIPVVDGEKPITFETIDALDNKNLDDDFLKWLSDNMFSGIGTPSSYLNDVENVEFARTISMQHQRYMREVMVEQLILNPAYSTIMQRLYELEYVANEKNRDKEKISSEKQSSNALNFDVGAISVVFPAPAVLRVNGFNNQFGDVVSITDNLVQNLDLGSGVDQEHEEKIRMNIKSKLIRHLLPTFDWETVDEMLNESKNTLTQENMRKKLADARNDAETAAAGGPSGMGGDNTSSDDTNDDDFN